ncbi:uncharacterized protein LOC144175496 [Haemaphysalis longicornis]
MIGVARRLDELPDVRYTVYADDITLEAQRTSQLERLGSTRTGRRLLQRVGLSCPFDEEDELVPLRDDIGNSSVRQGSNPNRRMKALIEDRVVHSPYPNINIPVRSFYSSCQERLRMQPDNPALVDNEMSLTRGELLVRLQRYAVGFKRHGVRPGDHVLIHLGNGVENLVAAFGCILAGATAVMAKPSLTEQEICYQAGDSGCTHALTEVQFAEKVVAATASLNMKCFFSMGPAVDFVSTAVFSTLDEKEFQECPVTDPKNTVMVVLYTSGSTGLPKGAEISHYNFVACFYLSRRASERKRHSPPLSPLLQATVMCTIPPRLHAIVREMRRTGRTLPTMRHIPIGGSVVTEWLSNAARSTFGGLQTLSNTLCMTEACFLVSAQPRCRGNCDSGSDVGFPAVTFKVKVVNTKTHEKLGPSQIGEVCFQSAAMVKGYHNRPKETADLFDKGGWMKSGDAGYYDEDGRLHIAERWKQMIKCMGNQVVPAEVEELLLQKHGDEIAEVSVVGLPHDEYEEAAAAAVVLTEKGRQQDRSEVAERLKTTVSANLSVQKHLHGGVFFVGSLPKTESSRVNRTALARLLGGRQ